MKDPPGSPELKVALVKQQEDAHKMLLRSTGTGQPQKEEKSQHTLGLMTESQES